MKRLYFNEASRTGYIKEYDVAPEMDDQFPYTDVADDVTMDMVTFVTSGKYVFPKITRPLTLEQEQAKKISELSESCAANIVAGVTLEGKTYPLQQQDQTNLASCVIQTLVNADPDFTANIWCSATVDDVTTWEFLAHTKDEILALNAAAEAHKLACRQALIALTDEVNACEDISSVTSITWTEIN